jgi:hypothetical protein
MWESKLQSVVALSSTEAEIHALARLVQLVMLMRGVLLELGFEQTEPTPIYMDNTGGISFAKDDGTYSGKKNVRHLEMRYAFIREAVSNKEVAIRHMSRKYNKADILTKLLAAPEYKIKRDMITSI